MAPQSGQASLSSGGGVLQRGRVMVVIVRLVNAGLATIYRLTPGIALTPPVAAWPAHLELSDLLCLRNRSHSRRGVLGLSD